MPPPSLRRRPLRRIWCGLRVRILQHLADLQGAEVVVERPLELLGVGLVRIRLAGQVVGRAKIDDDRLAGRDSLCVAGLHLQGEETVLHPGGAIRYDNRIRPSLAHAHVVADLRLPQNHRGPDSSWPRSQGRSRNLC